MSRPEILFSGGLVYYPDNQPGIKRQRRGSGFTYIAVDGTRIERGAERERLEAMAVPPAYSDVWMSPLANGHLQATGHDARHRKQYRYHADCTTWQARKKFEHLADFGDTLPRLRRWIDTRLQDGAGSREAAIAAILSLIDRASLRIGNATYTDENESYGATTLENRHVAAEDGYVRLDFKGKGGSEVHKDFYAPRLSALLDASQDLPGAAVLCYLDPAGKPHAVRSEQINDVLGDLCGDGMTAKTFRTWNGTHAAFQVARKSEKLTIKAMTQAAAARLHSTETIARNSYIHPDVIALAQSDDRAQVSSRDEGNAPDGLRAGEMALLRFLRRA